MPGSLRLAACLLALGVPAVAQGMPEAPEASTRTQEGVEGFEGFEEEFAVPGSTESSREAFDPLRGYNRIMFAFNDRFFLWLWDPVAHGYAFVLPTPVRQSVNKVFINLAFPVRFGNSLFQLKLKRAGLELGRFLVNSTIGLAGLFDPADAWLGWRPPPREDFGQTLGRYGVGGGPHVVLPLLGGMNLRDAFSLIPDIALSPIVYVANTPESLGLRSGDIFNRSSLHLGEYQSLKKDALDPYTFFRDVYEEKREADIQE